MFHIFRSILFLLISSLVVSFHIKKFNHRYKKPLNSVEEWLKEGPDGDTSQNPNNNNPRNITLRFINNLSGKDVTIEVEEGSNLLAMGDLAGVKLPRACRTGLCGSCTCEVKDPQAIGTASNPRNGFATIRACSTKCYIPEGMDEMVIDVYRMKNRAEAIASKNAASKGMAVSSTASAKSVVPIDYTDPMARFSGDWEKEFRPQWEISKLKEGQGRVGAMSNPKFKVNPCSKCDGAGRVVCYACDGRAKTMMGTGNICQCAICVGRGTVGCGACRGTGKTK